VHGRTWVFEEAAASEGIVADMLALSASDALKADPKFQVSSGWIEDQIRTTTQVGMQIVSAAATAPVMGPIGPMADMYYMLTGASYANYKAQNPNAPDERMAMTNALVQTPFEWIGIKKLTKFLKPKKAFKQILKDYIDLGLTEFVTESLQSIGPDQIFEILATSEPSESQLQLLKDLYSSWEPYKQAIKEGVHGAVASMMFGTAAVIKNYNKRRAQEEQGIPEPTGEGADIAVPDLVTEGGDPDVDAQESGRDIASLLAEGGYTEAPATPHTQLLAQGEYTQAQGVPTVLQAPTAEQTELGGDQSLDEIKAFLEGQGLKGLDALDNDALRRLYEQVKEFGVFDEAGEAAGLPEGAEKTETFQNFKDEWFKGLQALPFEITDEMRKVPFNQLNQPAIWYNDDKQSVILSNDKLGAWTPGDPDEAIRNLGPLFEQAEQRSKDEFGKDPEDGVKGFWAADKNIFVPLQALTDKILKAGTRREQKEEAKMKPLKAGEVSEAEQKEIDKAAAVAAKRKELQKHITPATEEIFNKIKTRAIWRGIKSAQVVMGKKEDAGDLYAEAAASLWEYIINEQRKGNDIKLPFATQYVATKLKDMIATGRLKGTATVGQIKHASKTGQKLPTFQGPEVIERRQETEKGIKVDRNKGIGGFLDAWLRPDPNEKIQDRLQKMWDILQKGEKSALINKADVLAGFKILGIKPGEKITVSDRKKQREAEKLLQAKLEKKWTAKAKQWLTTHKGVLPKQQDPERVEFADIVEVPKDVPVMSKAELDKYFAERGLRPDLIPLNTGVKKSDVGERKPPKIIHKKAELEKLRAKRRQAFWEKGPEKKAKRKPIVHPKKSARTPGVEATGAYVHQYQEVEDKRTGEMVLKLMKSGQAPHIPLAQFSGRMVEENGKKYIIDEFGKRWAASTVDKAMSKKGQPNFKKNLKRALAKLAKGDKLNKAEKWALNRWKKQRTVKEPTKPKTQVERREERIERAKKWKDGKIVTSPVTQLKKNIEKWTDQAKFVEWLDEGMMGGPGVMINVKGPDGKYDITAVVPGNPMDMTKKDLLKRIDEKQAEFAATGKKPDVKAETAVDRARALLKKEGFDLTGESDASILKLAKQVAELGTIKGSEKAPTETKTDRNELSVATFKRLFEQDVDSPKSWLRAFKKPALREFANDIGIPTQGLTKDELATDIWVKLASTKGETPAKKKSGIKMPDIFSERGSIELPDIFTKKETKTEAASESYDAAVKDVQKAADQSLAFTQALVDVGAILEDYGLANQEAFDPKDPNRKKQKERADDIEALINYFSTDYPWIRKGMRATGRAFKRYFGIRTNEQIKALEAAKKFMRMAVEANNGSLSREFQRDILFLAEDPEYIDEIEGERNKEIAANIAGALNDFFAEYEQWYKNEGVEFDFKARMKKKVEEKMKEAEQGSETMQLLIEQLDFLERMNFVHIPAKVLYDKSIDELTSSDRRGKKQAVDRLRLMNIQKRTQLSLRAIWEQAEKKGKVDEWGRKLTVPAVMINYGSRAGKDRAAIELRNAFREDGIAFDLKKYKKRPQGKSQGKGKLIEMKSQDKWGVFAGNWVDPKAYEMFEAMKTIDETPRKLDKAVATTKMLAFINPLFLGFYDVYQHMMSGVWLVGLATHPIRTVTNIGRAIKAVATYNETMQEAADRGSFSKPFDYPWVQMQQQMDRIADMKVDKGAQAAHWLWSATKDAFKQTGEGTGKNRIPFLDVELYNPLNIVLAAYKPSWQIAWKLDEVVRTYTYLQFKDQKLLTKKDVRAAHGIKDRRLRKEYLRKLHELKAAELTAKFHGDYASVPTKSRKQLNRWFFTPTFKIAMAKLYGQMMKSAWTVPRDFVMPGRKVDPMQARYFMGIMGTISVNFAYDLIMKGLGYEPDDEEGLWILNWGRKYVKRDKDRLGPSEVTFTWSNPGNMPQRYLQRMARAYKSDDTILNKLLQMVRWDLHPVINGTISLATNRDPEGNQISSKFDDPDVKVLRQFYFAADQVIALLDTAEPVMKKMVPPEYMERAIDSKSKTRAMAYKRENFNFMQKWFTGDFFGVANITVRDVKERRISIAIKVLQKEFRSELKRANMMMARGTEYNTNKIKNLKRLLKQKTDELEAHRKRRRDKRRKK
jgi:hypothetical protein